MPKNVALDTMIVIRRVNTRLQADAAKPFKIVDGISCGNCTSFIGERCNLKSKAVKAYNICEKHVKLI